MFLMRRLHLTQSWASSLDSSLSDKSFLMLSNHLRFGLHRFISPGTSIITTLLPTYNSYNLCACKNGDNCDLLLRCCINLIFCHLLSAPIGSVSASLRWINTCLSWWLLTDGRYPVMASQHSRQTVCAVQSRSPSLNERSHTYSCPASSDRLTNHTINNSMLHKNTETSRHTQATTRKRKSMLHH